MKQQTKKLNEIITQETNEAILDIKKGFTSINEEFNKIKKEAGKRAKELYEEQTTITKNKNNKKVRHIYPICFFLNTCNYNQTSGDVCTSEDIPSCKYYIENLRSYIRHGFLNEPKGQRKLLEDKKEIIIRI